MSKINLRTLAAMTHGAAEETRYYLNGVSVEIDANGVTYAATDGHTLLAVREDLAEDDPRNESLGTAIIATADCKAVKLPKGQTTYLDIADITLLGEKVTIEHRGSARTFTRIDGSFPDWRRVVPDSTSEFKPLATADAPHFDPRLIVNLQKFMVAMGEDISKPGNLTYRGPRVHYGAANSPSPVTFPGLDNAIGVVMPYCQSSAAWVLPAWAKA